MAVNAQDLRYVKPIASAKRSTGVVSGVIDCGISGVNAHRLTLICDKTAFAGKVGKCTLSARHAAASGVTYASATAFNTAATVTTASTASADLTAIFIDRGNGTGRFVRVLLSSITASSDAGVVALLSENAVVPPTTTGFSSVKQVPAGP